MWRVTGLLKRRPGPSREEFLARWQEKHIPLMTQQSSLRGLLRRYVANLPLGQTPEGLPDAYDGACELWFDDLATARKALADPALSDTARKDLAGFADIDHSVFEIGEVRECLDSKPVGVKMMIFGRRKAGLSLDEAQRYWGETHPKVAQTAKAFWSQLTRYRQIHLRHLDDFPAGGLPHFDMSADIGAPSLETYMSAFANSEYAAIVRPDELKFADLGTATGFVASKEVIWEVPVHD